MESEDVFLEVLKNVGREVSAFISWISLIGSVINTLALLDNVTIIQGTFFGLIIFAISTFVAEKLESVLPTIIRYFMRR